MIFLFHTVLFLSVSIHHKGAEVIIMATWVNKACLINTPAPFHWGHKSLPWCTARKRERESMFLYPPLYCKQISFLKKSKELEIIFFHYPSSCFNFAIKHSSCSAKHKNIFPPSHFPSLLLRYKFKILHRKWWTHISSPYYKTGQLKIFIVHLSVTAEISDSCSWLKKV